MVKKIHLYLLTGRIILNDPDNNNIITVFIYLTNTLERDASLLMRIIPIEETINKDPFLSVIHLLEYFANDSDATKSSIPGNAQACIE